MHEGLAELFTLPDGYEVVLGLGGSHAFFDAAMFGLIRERSQHLVHGDVTRKFAKAVPRAPFLADPDVLKSEFSTHPDAGRRSGRRRLRMGTQRDLDRRHGPGRAG